MFGIFPKNDGDQTLRIKQFLMAFGSYLACIALISVAYLQDLTRISLDMLVVYFLGVIVWNISIYAVIRTGLNKRFKDPGMILLQMVVATFWVMVVVYYAESVRSAVLLIYLTVFVFGIFSLHIVQFLFLSAFAIISYTLVILLLVHIQPESVNKRAEILNILILATVLPWFSLVVGYITKLKTRIYEERCSVVERLIDDLQEVIFVLDMNLDYIYVSPTVKILRGYEPEEVLKQKPLDALTPASLDLVMKTFSAFIEMEKLGHKVPAHRILQLEVKRKDGSSVWTEAKFSLIRDENRRPARIIGIMRDITEHKNLNNK
ncbi:MAG: PAS domain S-box protein [Syntrophaceae bacterium]|nr:PAS domain S-box protein [Syntrophaceae bacterium]